MRPTGQIAARREVSRKSKPCLQFLQNVLTAVDGGGAADVHSISQPSAQGLLADRRASTGQLATVYSGTSQHQQQVQGAGAFGAVRLHAATSSQHQYHPASSLGVVHEGAVVAAQQSYPSLNAHMQNGGYGQLPSANIQGHVSGVQMTRPNDAS